MHDRQTRKTQRIGADPEEVKDAYFTYPTSISADGQYVTYISPGIDLATDKVNKSDNAIVHNRKTGKTERVSVSSTGKEGNFNSSDPSISADGRFVTFGSSASNLVVRDTNSNNDIFLRDRFINTKQTSDIAVTSSAFVDNSQKKQRIFYQFNITNLDNATATNVVLTDVLSSHLNIISVKTSRGSCSVSHVLLCRLGKLEPSTQLDKAIVLVVTEVQPKAPKTLDNVVSVNANEREINLADNRVELTTRR